MTSRARAAHNRRKALLGLALFVALAIHAFIIALLHDVEIGIPSYGRGRAYLESHFSLGLHSIQDPAEKQLDEQWKNEQLAHAFHAFIRPASKAKLISTTSNVHPSDIDNAIIPNPLAASSVGGYASGEGSMALEQLSTLPLCLGTASGKAILSEMASDELSGLEDGLLDDGLENVENHSQMRHEWDDEDPLAQVANSDNFILDIAYIPYPYGSGYLFEIRFIPKPGTHFKRISQNVFFLIDRSHSIDSARFEQSKQAVIAALPLLQKGDTFNILVFDNKVVSMDEQNILVTPHNIAKAKKFLLNIPYGGIFATTDLYTSIHKIVPEAVSDYEVNTAILFSDGDTFLAREQQRQRIAQWTEANQGKVSLYCIASGRRNNLPLLHLLAWNNKGTLTYVRDYNQLPNMFLSLLKGLRSPIGKDMVASAIPSQQDHTITLYPRPWRLPDLYEDTPYTLYGHTDKLEDFHLFLQGKYYDHRFDIKKNISFQGARQANVSELLPKFTLNRAFDHYDLFLKDGCNHHLATIKALLAPLNIPTAFY